MMVSLNPVDANFWILQETINIRQAAFVIAGFEPTQTPDPNTFPTDKIQLAAQWLRNNIPIQSISHLNSVSHSFHVGLSKHNESIILMIDLLNTLDTLKDSCAWGKELLLAKENSITRKDSRVNNKFLHLKNLHPNEISVVVYTDKIRLYIRNNKITAYPYDINIKTESKYWKIIQQGASNQGNLKSTLKRIYKTNNHASYANNVSTAINRLNEKLIITMGLVDKPIKNIEGDDYVFTFKKIQHFDVSGGQVTSKTDALDHSISISTVTTKYNMDKEDSGFDDNDETEYHDDYY